VWHECRGLTVCIKTDEVQVTKVVTSGFYCIDVESFQQPGTESNLNTLITTVKVIVGGVAPLLMPWCIKNQVLTQNTRSLERTSTCTSS
jgi:hypothetical protein